MERTSLREKLREKLGKQGRNLHCGFIAAPFRATMVDNLPDCPLVMTKYQIGKYVKGRIWKN